MVPCASDNLSTEIYTSVTGSACKEREHDKGNASSSAAHVATTEVNIEATKKKKKKTKRTKGSARIGNPPFEDGRELTLVGYGQSKPSGFEEYVVDGPLTKEEVENELALYNPSKPFSQRIELCIQRYKARRKWDPKRLQLFTTYLALGGVATGQKQFFGGMDEKKMDDMDAEHIAMMAATDYIQFQDQNGRAQEDVWEVDFAYVVRGYLSYKVPYVMGYKKPNDLELACRLIKNFLNYVLFHSVAPEYGDNIRQAIIICSDAERELVLCTNVSNHLPGTFNMACSTIYDGFYAGVGELNKTWEIGVDQVAGFDENTARELVTVALLKRGTPENQKKGLNRKVVRRDYMSLEVTEVIQGRSEPRQCNNDDKSQPENRYYCKLQALGKLKVKPWIPEDPLAGENVLPKDQVEELELWLEKCTLQFCFVGMHLEARVHRFDDGLIFVDSVTGVMCSFYLRLENPITDDKDSDDDYD